MNPTLIHISKNPLATPKESVSRLTAEPPPVEHSESAAIDLAAALVRVMGDEDFLWELIREFLGELPRVEIILEKAIVQRDVKTITRFAHRVEGAAGNLGATPLSDAAFKMEQIARNGSFELADKAFKRLSVEMDRLISHINQIELLPLKTAAFS